MNKNNITVEVIDKSRINEIFNYDIVKEKVRVLESQLGCKLYSDDTYEEDYVPQQDISSDEYAMMGISYDILMSTIKYNIENPFLLEEELNEISMNELRRIAEYYDIKKSRKKVEIIQNIIEYECDPGNIEDVFRRRKLWFYLNEIKADNYLNKYILIE